MSTACEIIYVAFLALNLSLAVSSRLLHCIRLVAAQGLLIGLLPLLQMATDGHWHAEAVIMAIVNLVLKGIIIPLLLARTMRKVNVRRELEPLLGYSLSCLIVLILTGLSFIVCHQIPQGGTQLFMPVAFATLLTGLFLIVARRKAITQALGFLVFENGITLFGNGMSLEYGMTIELGVLLDVFVLVFIMGIAVYQINREFNHIDADRLNQLGDAINPGKDPLAEATEEDA